METIGISCSCSNTEAFKLSDIAAECTSCSTVHTITDEPVFITRSITPLHIIAKQQAFEDMCISMLQDKLNEWDVETHDAWIEEQLESMYRRDAAGQHACALDAGIINQEQHDNLIHNLNIGIHTDFIMGSFDINGDIADWATCFDTDNIRYAV